MFYNDGQELDCLLNCLIKLTTKNTFKLCITGSFVQNPSVADGFPSQRASVENITCHDIVLKLELRGFVAT